MSEVVAVAGIGAAATLLTALATQWIAQRGERERELRRKTELEAQRLEDRRTRRLELLYEMRLGQSERVRNWIRVQFVVGLDVAYLSIMDHGQFDASLVELMRKHIEALLASQQPERPEERSLEVALSGISDERLTKAVRDLNTAGDWIKLQCAWLRTFNTNNPLPWNEVQRAEAGQLLEPLRNSKESYDRLLAATNRALEDYVTWEDGK
jgi:hypothetical protein